MRIVRPDYAVVARYYIRMCGVCMDRFESQTSQFVRAIQDEGNDAYSSTECPAGGVIRCVSFHSPSREIAYKRIKLLKREIGIPDEIEHEGFSWRKAKKGGLGRRLKKD